MMHKPKRTPPYKHNRPTIGVLAGWRVYTGTLDTFLGPVYQGTRAAAQDLGCNLLLSCSVDVGIGQGAPRPAWAVPLPDVDFIPVGPWNVDGLLIVGRFSSEPTASYLQRLVAEGYPIVFVGAGEKGPTVMADNEGGIRQAMAHLIEHGHRRIAFIAGYQRDGDGDSARRLNAYHAVLEEHGLENDPRLLAYGSHSTGGGRQAMEQILAADVPFTALVASNDLSALGAMQVLSRAGKRIPQDVAVIGFDDRLEATAHTPSLTTIRYPAFEEGYQGVELLLKYIGGQLKGHHTVQIPTQLIVRESCGCLIGVSSTTIPPSQTPQENTPDTSKTAGDEALALAAMMNIHVQGLPLDELQSFCQELVDAFIASLKQSDGFAWHLTLRQVLQRLMASGNNLHAWQTAISFLQDTAPALIDTQSDSDTQRQAEELLAQARHVISEMAHEQYTRHLLRQIDIADQMGRMTARFLAAQDEAGIFAVLPDSLPKIGIKHALVAFYESEGDDPAAWSVVQAPQVTDQEQRRFPSRQFPPDGLYPVAQPFSLALLPLRVQGGATGFIAFDSGNLEPCADVVRQLAAALRSVNLYHEAVKARRLAEERRQMAEEANRLKSRFLSMVSHELRTPLNLISGLSDLLLRETQPEAASNNRQEDLERIYVNAQHLDGLIRDVLDLTRIEVGQLQLSYEAVDIHEMLEPVIVIARQLTKDKVLHWHSEIPAELPRVWGDRTRLRQVVLNLINNAVKFTTQGEVGLQVSVCNNTVTVSVRDTGLGISPEEKTLIFDEFRQSERTSARGYGGLGLGLAICKLLVEMHQGTIGVHSSGEEGDGAEFYFTLPVMEQDAAGESDTVACDQVLLLTEDVTQGQRLKQHLAHKGVDIVMHAVDVDTDWRTLLCGGSPDAVILDQAVTAAHGWNILRTLKEYSHTRDVPVLCYTLSGDGDKGALLPLDFMMKPLGKTQLAEMLLGHGLLDPQGDVPEARKILVVDDDPNILAMHTRMVQAQSPGDSQYHVLQAHNGREALDILQREQPDLVLLDLMMPELDGFGVLEAMRDDPATQRIPVVILTAQVLTEDDMARLNRGMVSILSKGLFSAEETLEHIEAMLARRRKTVLDVQRLVHKAMAFIHTHYMDPLTRGEIAAHVGLSGRHLTRCFQQEVGMTPMTYLNRYRIQQAKALLDAGDMGITEIAMAVGFSSGGYFTRVFRQEIGVSPREYLSGDENLSYSM